jgi:hypothetical protein
MPEQSSISSFRSDPATPATSLMSGSLPAMQMPSTASACRSARPETDSRCGASFTVNRWSAKWLRIRFHSPAIDRSRGTRPRSSVADGAACTDNASSELPSPPIGARSSIPRSRMFSRRIPQRPVTTTDLPSGVCSTTKAAFAPRILPQLSAKARYAQAHRSARSAGMRGRISSHDPRHGQTFFGMFGVMAGDHAYTPWLDEPLPERGWTSDQVDELHADLAYWDAIGTPRPKVRREQSTSPIRIRQSAPSELPRGGRSGYDRRGREADRAVFRCTYPPLGHREATTTAVTTQISPTIRNTYLPSRWPAPCRMRARSGCPGRYETGPSRRRWPDAAAQRAGYRVRHAVAAVVVATRRPAHRSRSPCGRPSRSTAGWCACARRRRRSRW